MSEIMTERERKFSAQFLLGSLGVVAVLCALALWSGVRIECNPPTCNQAIVIGPEKGPIPELISLDCRPARVRIGEGDTVLGTLCDLPDGQVCFSYYHHDLCWHPEGSK